MTQLTANEAAVGKSFFYDFLHIVTSGKSDFKLTYPRLRSYYQSVYFTPGLNNDITEIYSAMIRGRVSYLFFKKLDQNIRNLTGITIAKSLNLPVSDTFLILKDEDGAKLVARWIANFCNKNNIKWDNSLLSSFESQEVRNTLLGEALDSFDCFKVPLVYSNPTSNTASVGSTTNGTSQPSSTPRATRKAPKVDPIVGNVKNPVRARQNNKNVNVYTTLGPLSSNLPNLISHAKFHPNVDKVWCIRADKKDHNRPSLYIRALDKNTGKALSGSEFVKAGHPTAYGAFELWFDDEQLAELVRQNASANATPYSNWVLVPGNPDPNGYFEVKTVVGRALIKARAVNENLIETFSGDELEIFISDKIEN